MWDVEDEREDECGGLGWDGGDDGGELAMNRHIWIGLIARGRRGTRYLIIKMMM